MLSRSFKCLVVCVSAAMLGACGQQVGFTASPVNEAQNPAVITSPIDIADAIPSCEVNVPELALEGSVVSFEFAGSAGVTFGYSGSGPDTGVSASATVQVSWADMDLVLNGVDPMALTPLATTEVKATQTKTNINATVGFDGFSANPYAYLATPLATMSANGLTTGVNAIKTQTDKLPWVGRILKHIDDNTVLINAGDLSGVKVGDIFSTNNVTYYWSGAPCSSTYQGALDDSATVDEVIQVTIADPLQNVAIATILQHGSVHSTMGAKVVVNKLVAAASGAPARYLKKSIALGQLTADPISVPGGTTFDLQSALNKQVVNVLNQVNAYIFTVPSP